MNKQTRMVSVFIDWGRKKKSVGLVENSGGEIKSDNLFQFSTIKELHSKIKSCQEVKSIHIVNFFLETGAPKVHFLYPLCDIGNVYLVPGKRIKDLREERKISKSDINDVFLIRDYYKEHPEHFHKIEKEDLDLAIAVSKYDYITKEMVRLENAASAFKKEFGKENELFLKLLEELKPAKEKLEREIKKQFPYLTKHCQAIGIKGLGEITLARYLARAHPKRFPSLSSWLGYMFLKAYKKYKNPSLGYKKDNINKSSFGGLHYNFASSLIKQKDPEYEKIRADLEKKFPNTGKKNYKAEIYAKTINRLVTRRLKEVWKYFKEPGSSRIVKSIEGMKPSS